MTKLIKNPVLLKSFSDDFFNDFFRNDFISKPSVNIIDDENKTKLEMLVPGMNKKDFKININDGVINISSESETKSDNSSENFIRKEWTKNSFSRSFILNDDYDEENISASYKDGILEITLPKIEVKKKTKVIEIN
jgi:HSP20 family protein